jgi:predicted ATP-binding protein involved in virulence
MRISEIRIQNFKGFKEHSETFDPNFTVFVGENGSGKTSMLEAVAKYLNSWASSMDHRYVSSENDVRITGNQTGSTFSFSEEYPIKISIESTFSDVPQKWVFEDTGASDNPFLDGESFHSTIGSIAEALRKSRKAEAWPIVTFYSVNRGVGAKPEIDWNHLFTEKHFRRDAYRGWRDSLDLISAFISWLGKQEAITFQEGTEPPIARSVKSAALSCLPDAKDLRFSAKHGEPIVLWNDGTAVTFSNLSHGQKSILAMVGDIARRCAMVNPHLEADAPAKTPGIVLIDELDLHLHPRWQRRIVDDLKRTFPEIQFITTTHSPFIIQALEPGELRVLGEDQPIIDYSNRGIEEIARFIQGVDMPQESERFTRQKEAAKRYFQMLRDGRDEDDPELLHAKSKLDKVTVSYADNPGLEAIIETQEAASPLMVREE